MCKTFITASTTNVSVSYKCKAIIELPQASVQVTNVKSQVRAVY